MTTKEKADLIVYINYLRSKGEESRRTSRKDGLADYFAGFCCGSGQRALDIADELDKFIEGVETTCEPETLPTYESVGSAEKYVEAVLPRSTRPTTAKSTRGSSASGAVRSARKFSRHIGRRLEA